MAIKVQVENAQGEIVRHEEMTLTQLNERCKPRAFSRDEYFYTPLGEYGMCEMCNCWYENKDRVPADHPRLAKCGFCSYECATEADDDAYCSDRSDWHDYQDHDYSMNY